MSNLFLFWLFRYKYEDVNPKKGQFAHVVEKSNMNYLITTIFFLTAFVLSVSGVVEQVTRAPSAERPKREFSYSSPIFKNNYSGPSVKPHPLPVAQNSQAVTPGVPGVPSVPVVGAFFGKKKTNYKNPSICTIY